MLTEMGLAAGIEMIRPAYPPAGQGILRLAVPARERPLRPLTPAAARHPHGSGELPWHPTWMTGTSRPGWPPPPPRSLARPGSAPRSRSSATALPRSPGPRSPCLLTSSAEPGSAPTGPGASHRPAERIGARVARQLLAEVDSGAPIDRHASDQIIPFAALAGGTSSFQVPFITETAGWLALLFLRAEVRATVNSMVVHRQDA